MKVVRSGAGVFALALVATVAIKLWPELTRPKHVDLAFRVPSPLELVSLPAAARFDFPLGSENAAMSYNAQHFTENHHLGEDLNGIGGENSDLGDPIYAIADGRVLLAREGGPGWGNVMIVLHAYVENGERKDVRRGQQIPTIGTATASTLPISILKCANF